MQGEHNQETHGNRSGTRLLLRGTPGPPRKRKTPRPPRAATSGPGNAALERARDKARAASPGARRRAKQRPEPAAAPREQQQEERPPLKDMDDDDLAALYQQAIRDGDDTLADQVMAEMDRRDGDDQAWSEQEDADWLDNLAKRKPRSERDQAKDAYQDWLQAQYLRAVEATNGALFSRLAQAEGIDDMALFNGTLQRTQLKKYASEELLRWFAQPGNTRMTETDFVTQWLGKQTTKDRDRLRSSLSEF